MDTRLPEGAPLGAKEALRRARLILSVPEMLVDSRSTRKLIEGLVAGLDKWPTVAQAIERDAEIFPLASWDMASPRSIIVWADNARTHGARPEKVAEAEGIARHWDTRDERTWPT